MRIALIGYGKMGKEIHGILEQRGHEISTIIDEKNQEAIDTLNPGSTDVAIEFSSPSSAFNNIQSCLQQGVKVISGTTGWLDHLRQIKDLTNSKDGTFFYASNFSLGVNLFFYLNQQLARLMKDYEQYEVQIEEIHHTEKLDQPSGTAITLAEGVINEIPQKTNWKNTESVNKTDLNIISKRLPNVPGTHTISYESEEDLIEIKHTAASRKGFALGAVKVAEWIQDKKGFLSMEDYLKLSK